MIEVSLVRDEHLHGQGVGVSAEALVFGVLRVGAIPSALAFGGAAHAEKSVFGDALALLEVVADNAEGTTPLGVVLVGHHGCCCWGRMALFTETDCGTGPSASEHCCI
jgi:hypothetical protein